MIRDLIATGGAPLWPVAALVLFVLLFAGIVIWTYSGRRDRFHYMRMLPLHDAPAVPPANRNAATDSDSTVRGCS